MYCITTKHSITNCNYEKQNDNLSCDYSIFCKIQCLFFFSGIAVMYIFPANFILPIFVTVKSCMILKRKNNYRTNTATCVAKSLASTSSYLLPYAQLSYNAKLVWWFEYVCWWIFVARLWILFWANIFLIYLVNWWGFKNRKWFQSWKWLVY